MGRARGLRFVQAVETASSIRRAEYVQWHDVPKVSLMGPAEDHRADNVRFLKIPPAYGKRFMPAWEN